MSLCSMFLCHFMSFHVLMWHVFVSFHVPGDMFLCHFMPLDLCRFMPKATNKELICFMVFQHFPNRARACHFVPVAAYVAWNRARACHGVSHFWSESVAHFCLLFGIQNPFLSFPMGSPDSVPPGKGSSVEPSKGGCGPSWADMFAILKGKKGMKGKESMKGKNAMKGKEDWMAIVKGKGKNKVANHEVPGKASVKVDVPAAPELVKTESTLTQLYEPKDCVLIFVPKNGSSTHMFWIPFWNLQTAQKQRWT